MENSKNSSEKSHKIRMDHTALFSGLKEAIFNRNDRRGLVIGSVADFQRHDDIFGEMLSKSELSEEEKKQFEKLRDDSKKKLAELQKHQTENAGIKMIDEPTRRESAPHVRRDTSYPEMLRELEALCSPYYSLTDKYSLGKTLLGAGAGGTVMLATNKSTKEKVALKTIDLKKQHRPDLIVMEIKVLKNLKHKNLVNFEEAFLQTKNDGGRDILYVVMEFLDGGPLNDVAENLILHEKHIAAIVKEILEGLNYMHEQNIFHRDIKSDNVLLDKATGQIKVTDFGYCANYAERTRSQIKTVAGTIYWMAPEIIRNEGNYDHKVDIWSLGILAVELFNGVPPYYEIKNQWQVFNMIKKHGRPPAIDRWFDMSPELRDFLDKCLVVNPDERARTQDLLGHPFLSKRCNLSDLIPYIKKAKETKDSV